MPENTAVSCAKTAEQIEILSGFWTRVSRMKRRRCGLMSSYFDHLLVIGCPCLLETFRWQNSRQPNLSTYAIFVAKYIE